MFVTTSPELVHWNESIAALTFAGRCRAVDLGGSLDAASAATEAELAAANKKIHELTALLKLKG